MELMPFFESMEPPDAEAHRRAGGRVVCTHGDVRQSSVAKGPFDWIVSHRSLQGFGATDLEDVFEAIDQRLAADGTLKVVIHNSQEVYDDVSQRCEVMGYRVGWGLDGPGKKAEIGLSTG